MGGYIFCIKVVSDFVVYRNFDFKLFYLFVCVVLYFVFFLVVIFFFLVVMEDWGDFVWVRIFFYILKFINLIYKLCLIK